MTALMKAVKSNDTAAATRLVTEGVDVDQTDPSGDAPLIMAAYLGHTEIVGLLLEAGADVAVVDPNMRATALHAAAYAGNAEAARLLIEHGVDIDAQGPVNGYTALHDAVWQNRVETARVLIEAGANTGLTSHAGETPLVFARARGHSEIVALLQS